MNLIDRALCMVIWGGFSFYSGLMQGNTPENDPAYKAKVSVLQLQLLKSNPEMLTEFLEVQLNENLVKAKERNENPFYRNNDNDLAMALDYRKNNPYPADINKGWVVGGFSQDGKFYSKQVVELSGAIKEYNELIGEQN